MSSDRPSTVNELVEFYYNIFKPLYSHMQVLNEPPLEMFFEMNAAFDHLSRFWHYGESEEQAVFSASGHLKRGCFDAFKIVYRDTVDHYQELRKIDTSIIDNGRFNSDMIDYIHQLKQMAIEARNREGDSRRETDWHKAFDLWYGVYQSCIGFDRTFYYSKKVEWARKKHKFSNWSRRAEGFIIGLAVSFICNPIKNLFVWIFKVLSDIK